MKKIASIAKQALPFILNKNTWLLVLAVASAFGVIAPEKATLIRDAVSPIDLPAM